jgi:hypothetical protein
MSYGSYRSKLSFKRYLEKPGINRLTRRILYQSCEITLDGYPQQRYPGFVTKIVPTADRAKATVMVKIKFKKYDQRL